jgi:transposase
LSTRIIRKYRRNLGYVYRRLRKSPFLSDYHKADRLIWCLKYQNCNFENYVFVDETTCRLWDMPIYHWRKPASYPDTIPCTEKDRKKVNVFGGISFKGCTNFAVFEENMDALLYREIMADYLLPFMAQKYNMDCYLHQDNDPKHTSKICKKFIIENGIKWIKSPAKSPDLNPIEQVWAEMKNFIRHRHCKTPEDVAGAIHEFQEDCTKEKCQKYINHLKKVIKIVISKDGDWSNH